MEGVSVRTAVNVEVDPRLIELHPTWPELKENGRMTRGSESYGSHFLHCCILCTAPPFLLRAWELG